MYVQNTGYAPRAGPTHGSIAWSVDVSSIPFTQPIVDADGTVFDGPWAFNNGDIKWYSSSPCGAGIVLTGWAVDTSGFLYGACDNGDVIAVFAENGTTLWTLQTEDGGSLTSVTLGTSMVYLGSIFGYVYGVSTEGDMVWSYPLDSAVIACPALSVDGAFVYIASGNGTVSGLAAETGLLQWRFAGGGTFLADPVVSPFGTIIVASQDGNLYALDGTLGTKLWQFQTSTPLSTTPVMSPAGTVYFAAGDGAVYAVEALTGFVVWVTVIGPSAGDGMALTPANVYIATDSALYGLDAVSGKCVMNSTAGAGLMYGPAIGPEGYLIGIGRPSASHSIPRLLAFQ